jgi:hypothetical protein
VRYGQFLREQENTAVRSVVEHDMKPPKAPQTAGKMHEGAQTRDQDNRHRHYRRVCGQILVWLGQAKRQKSDLTKKRNEKETGARSRSEGEGMGVRVQRLQDDHH